MRFSRKGDEKRLELLNIRDAIYDEFHSSKLAQEFFFRDENADRYAAFYTSMYLIADTGESIWHLLNRDFSPDELVAYLEFWGVMQAIIIQQDAVSELYQAVVGSALAQTKCPAWQDLRELRNLSAGHPANQVRNKSAPRRTFMGRGFLSCDRIQFEMFDKGSQNITHPVYNLRELIEKYDSEICGILREVLSEMKTNWQP
jgi:hypothetical protein